MERRLLANYSNHPLLETQSRREHRKRVMFHKFLDMYLQGR